MHMQEDRMPSDRSDDAPPTPLPLPGDRIIGGVDIGDVAGCPCLAFRRAGRMSTQVFDAHLQPCGLTIGQFGVMAQVHFSSLSQAPLTMKELSNAIGMDPTTLNRTLKPLEAQGLVSISPDPRDRRVRCVQLTAGGRERLAQAAPLWREAGDKMRRIMGPETLLALRGLLSLAGEKMRQAG
jgi:DNA-binding MarR family transcriptional regulator